METPGWLETMVKFHATDPRVGTVTGAVEFDDGTVQGYGAMLVCPEGLYGRGAWPSEPAGRRTAHERSHNPRTEEVRRLPVPAEVDSAMRPSMHSARAAAREVA